MGIPTWSVVATVDEPAALVAAFVRHHLALGATEVFVFLDNPDPAAEAALSGLEGCILTVCDADYWANSTRGKRPRMHPGRQIYNANAAYAQTRADWLLHCDCDEFLRETKGLLAELARAGENRVFLRLFMAERVYTGHETGLFDGVFRHFLPDYDLVGPAIYGEYAGYFKDGLTGHKAGKAIVRTGRDVKMGIHSPEGHPPHLHVKSTHLLHFDGLTRLHYALKLLRRAHEPPQKAPPRHGAPRMAQFGHLKDAADRPEEVARLVNLMKSLTEGQADILRQLGQLDDRPFSPQAQELAETGLTPQAFDAELRRRHGAFLATHAPLLLDAALWARTAENNA